MSEESESQEEVLKKIDALQEEISELSKMLIVVASSVAMIEGMGNVTHTYLQRALAKLENTNLASLKQEYSLTDELASELERGFELMEEEAREMDLNDLAEYLAE